jgi:hypothetical protein
MAYYYDHREELQQQMKEDDAIIQQMMREDKLKRGAESKSPHVVAQADKPGDAVSSR